VYKQKVIKVSEKRWYRRI